MRGWVYIISNPAIPNLVKIGYSMKDPQLRAKDFAGTGVPFEFKVEWDILVDDPRFIEQATHKLLHHKREAKEWFRCTVIEAVNSIKKAASDITQYAERGVLQDSEQYPYPFEIVDPNFAYNIWAVLLKESADNDGGDVEDDADYRKKIDTENPKSMRQYFKRAIDLGSIDALELIATWLRNGRYAFGGVLQDDCCFFPYEKSMDKKIAIEEANRIFKRIFPGLLERAESGSSRDAFRIAQYYLEGVGVTADKNKAVYWFIEAASADAEYAFNFACKYYWGHIDLAPNYVESFKWFAESAKNGNYNAGLYLAEAYRDGLGVAIDLEAAKLWARKVQELNPNLSGNAFNRINDLI